MTDAARIIGEATTERLGVALATMLGGRDMNRDDAAEIAAAALALIIEGRESGAFLTATSYVDDADSLSIPEAKRQGEALRLLRALAGL